MRLTIDLLAQHKHERVSRRRALVSALLLAASLALSCIDVPEGQLR